MMAAGYKCDMCGIVEPGDPPKPEVYFAAFRYSDRPADDHFRASFFHHKEARPADLCGDCLTALKDEIELARDARYEFGKEVRNASREKVRAMKCAEEAPCQEKPTSEN